MDLQRVLAGCLSPDAQIRSQAEAALNDFTKQPESILQLLHHLQSSPAMEVQAMAAFAAAMSGMHAFQHPKGTASHAYDLLNLDACMAMPIWHGSLTGTPAQLHCYTCRSASLLQLS